MALVAAGIAVVALPTSHAMSSWAPAAPSAAATASGGAKTVDIRNFAFHPGTVQVARGTRVVFSNSSGVAHTATGRGVFNTGVIGPGHSVAVRFKRSGAFPYICTIHRFMHGKIIVH